MLPDGDRTPREFAVLGSSLAERMKRPIRHTVYPLYRFFIDWWLRNRGFSSQGLEADFWLWGQRGNDYEALRRRVNRILPIKGKRLLIAGCGTGRDIASWLKHEPAALLGVDYFSYETAWNMLRAEARRRYPDTLLEFRQTDLTQLEGIPDASIDIVGSDAVFEHVSNLPGVLREFQRVLAPGGVVYATFGPLWYCWGGDHISGYDGILSGYNHLLLERESYFAYLDRAGEHRHSEHDGRTWIENGLFSYLRPAEYLDALRNAGFERRLVGAILEPRAIECLRQSPEMESKLLRLAAKPDLIITGMTIAYSKPGAFSAGHKK